MKIKREDTLFFPISILYTILAYHNQVTRWSNADLQFSISDNCQTLYCHVYTLISSSMGIVFIYALQGMIMYAVLSSINKILTPRLSKRQIAIFRLAYFTPVLFWGSLFIGKDGFIALISGLTFLWLKYYKKGGSRKYFTWYLVTSITCLISRPYFGLIFIFGIALSFAAESLKRTIKKLLNGKASMINISIFLIGIVFMAGLIYWGSYVGHFELAAKMYSDEDFAVKYANETASLILLPLPFPLSLLQIFRPFPWDGAPLAYKIYSTFSLYVFTSCILIYQWISHKLTPDSKDAISLDSGHIFALVIFAALFSLNPNIGDIARKTSVALYLGFIGTACIREMTVANKDRNGK